ncbi:hypothetical protein BKA81DRAFT_37328 [Phyllosticta paracitricarpa]
MRVTLSERARGQQVWGTSRSSHHIVLSVRVETSWSACFLADFESSNPFRCVCGDDMEIMGRRGPVEQSSRSTVRPLLNGLLTGSAEEKRKQEASRLRERLTGHHYQLGVFAKQARCLPSHSCPTAKHTKQRFFFCFLRAWSHRGAIHRRSCRMR